MALLGVKELKGDLRKVTNVLTSTLRVASYYGARVIRDEAKRLAPRKTGRSVQFIAAARAKGTKTTGKAEVGFLRPGFNLAILTVGAKRHTVTALSITKFRDPVTRVLTGGARIKKRKVLALSAGSFLGAIVFGKSIETSARRNPFLHTAVMNTKVRVLSGMTTIFNEAIAKKEAAL